MMITKLMMLGILMVATATCGHQCAIITPSDVKPVNSVPKADTLKAAFSLDYAMGKFDPNQHADFVEIPIKYSDQKGRKLRKDVLDAFIKMYNAALSDGVHLKIISATRNFDYQKGIWERKWTGKTILEDGVNAADIKDETKRARKILNYSSMPGSSRHHWGTDFDLNALYNHYFESGYGKKVYQWLVINAGSFGFCQVYSEKNDERPNGYNEEKWHWSYIPVANQIMEVAKRSFDETLLTGFLGANTAAEIHILDNYILGINKNCTADE